MYTLCILLGKVLIFITGHKPYFSLFSPSIPMRFRTPYELICLLVKLEADFTHIWCLVRVQFRPCFHTHFHLMIYFFTIPACLPGRPFSKDIKGRYTFMKSNKPS